MIRIIIQSARRLDLWLRDRLGRPYNMLLGVGLTIEIVRRLMEMPEMVTARHRLFGSLLVLILDLALLVHQVGEMGEHFGPREAHEPPPEKA